MTEKRVAVIGAGITGLTAAFRLQNYGYNVELFESSDRVGGSIQTVPLGRATVDIGPSGILASRQSVLNLVDDLGLTDQWLEASPDSNRRYIYYKGQLNEVPSSPPKLLLAPWIPLSSKLRILTEYFRSPKLNSDSESLEELVTRRFGRFVADVMVDAMVSGIHAAPAKSLEAKAAFPILQEFEQNHGSILKGLIQQMKSRKRQLPEQTSTLKGMLNLRGGLETLPRALAEQLKMVHLNTPVTGLQLRSDGWLVESNKGAESFSHVVLTLPAKQAAKCLTSVDPTLVEQLDAFEYTPLGNVIFYFEEPIESPPGFGYLSPGIEDRPILGCLFLERIFPELVPKDCTVLRAFIGGQRASDQVKLSDDDLIKVVTDELQAVLKCTLPTPTQVKVVRWPTSLPFYGIGTSARWQKLEATLTKFEGLYLGGNWIHGASVADCVSRGDTLAKRILEQ